MANHHPEDSMLLEYVAGALEQEFAVCVSLHLLHCPACRQRVQMLSGLAGALFYRQIDAELTNDQESDFVSENLQHESSILHDTSFDLSNVNSAEQGLACDRDPLWRAIEDAIDSQEAAPVIGPRKSELRTVDSFISTFLNTYLNPQKESGFFQKIIDKIWGASRNDQLKQGHQSSSFWEQLPWHFQLPKLSTVLLSRHPSGRELALHKIRRGGKIPSHTHLGAEWTLVLEGGFSDQTGAFDAGDFIIRDQLCEHAPTANQDGDCICLTVIEKPVAFTGFLSCLNWFNSSVKDQAY